LFVEKEEGKSTLLAQQHPITVNKMLKIALVIVGFLVLGFCAPSSRTTKAFPFKYNCSLYVSLDGDDNNDGSKTAPFKTFNRAIKQVQTNESDWGLDKVYVCVVPGTYDLSKEQLYANSKNEKTNLTFIPTDNNGTSTIKSLVLNNYFRKYLGFYFFDIDGLTHNETLPKALGASETLVGSKKKYKATPLFDFYGATLFSEVIVGYGNHSYNFTNCVFSGDNLDRVSLGGDMIFLVESSVTNMPMDLISIGSIDINYTQVTNSSLSVTLGDKTYLTGDEKSEYWCNLTIFKSNFQNTSNGAIFVDGSIAKNVTLDVRNSSFSNNVAPFAGGALRLVAAKKHTQGTVANNTFDCNTCTNCGKLTAPPFSLIDIDGNVSASDIREFTAGNNTELHCPFECPPTGYFSSGGAWDCIMCDKGSYSKVPNATECPECGKGLYNTEQGLDYCENCTSSKKVTGDPHTKCKSCGWGLEANKDRTKCKNSWAIGPKEVIGYIIVGSVAIITIICFIVVLICYKTRRNKLEYEEINNAETI